MIKVGITGGIGSGKSIVSQLFRMNGIPVYDADSEAKLLNDKSPVIRQQLTDAFGDDIYHNEKLDRGKLASIIFADPQKLKIANNIIHPQLSLHFGQWCAQQALSSRISAIEAPLLFETDFHIIVDKIITVYAPINIRLQRASRRDNTSVEAIARRAQYQLADEEKIKRSDFVIHNYNSHSLIKQVGDIIKTLENI